MPSHQVLVSASAHDAVTNHALALRDVLRRFGPSEIHARHVDPALSGEVRPLSSFPAERGASIVFHGSIGDPSVVRFLQSRPEPIVLVYHNVTPPEFFRPYDPGFAALLELGRSQLALLRDRVQLALGVSEYDAAELRRLGYDDVAVSPLVLDTDAMLEREDDPWTAQRLATSDGPLILSVSQLLPHKRPDVLVRAFHILRTYLHGTARMALVGPARLPSFERAVGQFARELNLPELEFSGPVSDAALSAYYRHAAAFVTASEHEGFGVPLVEAMAFDVPIVARATAAIPDTLGDAGLLLPSDAGPALLAEALLAVLEDDQLRRSLVARGRARCRLFRASDATRIFERHLRSVL